MGPNVQFVGATVRTSARRETPVRVRYPPRMLWTVVVILVLLWFLGLLLKAFGGLIHLLLIAALVVVIYRLVTGRKLI